MLGLGDEYATTARTNRRAVGAPRPTATTATPTHRSSGQRSPHRRQWHAVDSTHGCAMARPPRALWLVEDGGESILPLARRGRVGPDAASAPSGGRPRGDTRR